jgi:hypothetical protein
MKTMKTAKNVGKMCQGEQFWTLMAGDYSHLLLMFNASINFFIYGLFGKQFRDVLKEQMFNVRGFFFNCEND